SSQPLPPPPRSPLFPYTTLFRSPEEDDKPEHENRQPHGPSLAKITIDVCAACCPAGAVEAMARREARSSTWRRRLHRPRRLAPVNSALAMTAAQVITPLPARDSCGR